MKVIEMEVNEFIGDGVFAISLVDTPANQTKFVTLSEKQRPIHMKVADTEKRLLVGVVLNPDQRILRRNEETQEMYYITFPEATIEKAAHLYMKNMAQGNVTIMHEGFVDGVRVVETWMVADAKNDKAAHLGLPVKKGSWVVTMKCDNNTVWDELVKTGAVLGFSLEGFFSDGKVVEEKGKLTQKKVLNATFKFPLVKHAKQIQ